MAESIIQFENISKRYRVQQQRQRSLQQVFVNLLRFQGRPEPKIVWSLWDVSFAIYSGEMVGLIGANGAGKSTALKLISRVIEPTSGQLQIGGRVTGLLELGAGFHPDLTGRENVYLNGAILGMKQKEIDRCFDDIVDFSELESFIDVPVKHYSSGMYMRLGFATAVHSDPDVLLVDEVLAVGDQSFQSKCFQRINQLRRGGTTIVFVTHDLSTVRRMCDRVVWLDQGCVRSIGAADEVIADYMSQVWHERDAQLALEACDADLDDVVEEKEPESVEQRWGSGEAVIERVVFLGQGADSEGREGLCERQVFCTGDLFVARIFYQTKEPIEQPTFGVAFYRDDGVHVNGTNSVIDGSAIAAIEGQGEVEYIIESLPLLVGEYEFTAAIYDYGSTHPYDHRHRAFRFQVQSELPGMREGAVNVPCVWQHRPFSASVPLDHNLE